MAGPARCALCDSQALSRLSVADHKSVSMKMKARPVKLSMVIVRIQIFGLQLADPLRFEICE